MPGKKLLLGLTTTPGSDWKEKIREIKKFGIKEIALFPTFLALKNRKELYFMLKKIGLTSIPHVHLRSDMKSWELDYFVKKFKTRIFNVHAGKEDYDFIRKNKKYRPMIFVENMYSLSRKKFLTETNFNKYKIAGICLDFSHLEIDRIIYPKSFYQITALLSKYTIGCNHISGVENKHQLNLVKEGADIARHFVRDKSELEFLKNFPANYFSSILSIELENSFEDQLKFKNYLENLLNF